MRVLCLIPILGFASLASSEIETATLRIQKIDIGSPKRGDNRFSALVKNKSESMVTLVLDLRADPGLWLRKYQRQFVYLLFPGQETTLEAGYQFSRMSPEGFLRVRMHFPTVAATGETKLGAPFFDRRYPIGEGNPDIDYDLSRFQKKESDHFLIYYFLNSTAVRDMDTIARERDGGFERVAQLAGVRPESKIRLFLFPDEDTKRKETGHQGAGWAFGNNVVEVYNEKTQLDPYHETAHIVANQLGSPASLFSEGFAVYVSELLGADALKELGSPGKTCDRVVVERRTRGGFIPLEQLLGFPNIGSESSQPSTSYPEACSFVKFLVGRHGWDKFRQAYATVSAGNTPALEKAYGTSAGELERTWLATLADGR